MRIDIESTEKIVNLSGVPARIWEGVTKSGIPIHCYITRVAVAEGMPADMYAQFEKELQECRKPVIAESIPLSMIL